MQNPKRDRYLVERSVKRQLERLGLHRAERILVTLCDDCPLCVRDLGSMEYHCNAMGRLVSLQPAVPPHDCPLRKRPLSIAIDPQV